ncbi:unnamed protein product [Prunus armeniaca]|uniref:Uncharacterized protein n=1 Tax=Prunus armeniaca TaxID=36596 RepID=A0A6J5V4S5_PRUAR|nr:unnamed protein product [Prunus armeniaca]CAB4312794.1 unnamed protein product [Prunus armeniaca]
MEGLLPLLYRTILQYRAGEQPAPAESWYRELPAVPYIPLPADSTSSNRSGIKFLLSPASAMSPPPSSQLIASPGIQFTMSASTSSPLIS